ncbi:Syntaxin-like protein [Operophtera brumata]|uniref:Syntaxin-like protein n=1 Tax=Operophtera brumata TaxID=104452 RepID=A0A0L7L416_OPEBR|nr:Syntaxin-like protein [Operophtera brumata]
MYENGIDNDTTVNQPVPIPNEVSKAPVVPNSPEVEWTSTELRNALRSIEWDLEDLEDTINILFKSIYLVMKGKMSLNRNRDNDGTAREPLLGEESPMHFGNSWTATPKYTKYSKLANQTDSPIRFDSYDSDVMSMQDKMLTSQNDQLHVISNSVGTLKTIIPKYQIRANRVIEKKKLFYKPPPPSRAICGMAVGILSRIN